MKSVSLSRRLAFAAIALIGFSLFGAGQLLVFMFRDHIEQRFDRSLNDHLEELVAASETDGAGALFLDDIVFEPHFNRPASGWYWQISKKGTVLAASQSLAGMFMEATPVDEKTIQQMFGPAGRPLRVMVRPISLPDTDGSFTYAVAGPIGDILGDVRRFSVITALTLAALGIGLVGAVLFQVHYGLRPLDGLRSALADIRSGQRNRMPETFPVEIEPVVDEVNALLDHNAALLARARTQAGDLAHALKHPLMVIAHQAQQTNSEEGQIIAEQISAMRGAVDRHLARARAAGPGGAVGVRASVAEVFDGLKFSLDLLYRDRGLSIEGVELGGKYFAGDAQDLEEMMGNLMENACKWGHSRIRVSATAPNGVLNVIVDDDGPGIDVAERESVLARGKRLDEAVAGAGLGLGIVRDIAELYRGELTLDQSDLGGLSAHLGLPAAPANEG